MYDTGIHSDSVSEEARNLEAQTAFGAQSLAKTSRSQKGRPASAIDPSEDDSPEVDMRAEAFRFFDTGEYTRCLDLLNGARAMGLSLQEGAERLFQACLERLGKSQDVCLEAEALRRALRFVRRR